MASKTLIRMVQPHAWRDVGRRSSCLSFPSSRTLAISWPRLESATGRARKRRLRTEKYKTSTNDEKRSMKGPKTFVGEEVVIIPPYPKGQPWRVLWPSSQQSPSEVTGDGSSKRYLPTWSELQHGWRMYVETWEDGIRGEPSAEKLRQRQAQQSLRDMELLEERRGTEEVDSLNVKNIQSNLYRNIKHAKENAQEIFEHAKDSKDDLQKMASESMKLATVCLKEFMSGYRQGRDQEIDKMLNEYFQDQTSPGTSVLDKTQSTAKQRRKKKRGKLR
jgi:hypothetical protein